MSPEEKEHKVIMITRNQFNKLVEILAVLREKFPSEGEFKVKLGDALFIDSPDNPRFSRLCYVNDYQVNVRSKDAEEIL